MASIEQFKAAGLFDPAVDEGTGRLALLQWLDAKGFTVSEMAEAFATGGLGALAGDHQLVQGPPLSNREAERIAGLGAQRLMALATAFGFAPPDLDQPAEFGLNEREATTLATFGAVATMFSEEEALGFVRVVGSSLARIAEAAVALFLADVEGPSLASSSSELDLAKDVLGAIELLDDFIPMLDPVLRRHVQQAVERTRQTIIDERERLQYRYAVGFIDLVGFTPLTQEMTASDLGLFIREFERRAQDAVNAVGARVVKLIGDEVMFVAPSPDSACEVAQTLMTEMFVADGRNVAPRGGVAYGPVLVRGGDYYGSVVNAASRLADVAEPGQLLATEAFAAVATCLEFDEFGPVSLRGFANPMPARSRYFELH